MTLPLASRTVKLGDILPSLGSFEAVLQSLKSYPLWPVVLREALLDRAVSGIVCSEEEMEIAWISWCKQNEVDPFSPVYEGLSVGEMRNAATRGKRIGKFKEQAFGKLVPEYFRSRKGELDRVHLEIVQFQHPSIAEEALFRCREGEQNLEAAAHQLAHRDGGEPPVKKVGPIGLGRLSNGLASLVTGRRPGDLLGPKKIGHFHVVVRVLELHEASLEDRTRQRMLDELLNQWLEQQIAALTGRARRSSIIDEESSSLTMVEGVLKQA